MLKDIPTLQPVEQVFPETTVAMERARKSMKMSQQQRGSEMGTTTPHSPKVLGGGEETETIELSFFLVTSLVLCFRFRMRILI